MTARPRLRGLSVALLLAACADPAPGTTDGASDVASEATLDAATDAMAADTTAPDGASALDVAADEAPTDASDATPSDASDSATSDATPSDASDAVPSDAEPAPDASGPPPRAVIAATPTRFRRGARTTVMLDASGSTGAGLRFTWIVGAGATVVAGSLDGPAVSVSVDGSADVSIALQATNGAGTDVARTVVVANEPPVATAADRAGPAGTALRLDAAGTLDREGDAITYAWRVAASPAGSSPSLTDATTATPSLVATTPGAYDVELVASDPLGPGAPVTAHVTLVGRARTPPRVTLSASPLAVAVGAPVALAVREVTEGSVATRTLTVDGSPVTLDARGDGSFTPTRAGAFEAVATVSDTEGNAGEARVTFAAHSGADNGAPTVSLTAPLDGADLEATTVVTGTASDADLVRYDLDVQRAGSDRWTPIGTGSAAVTAGRLGALDPSLFGEGAYTLRLRALDAWGNTATAARAFTLSRVVPIGAERFAFRDVSLRFLGAPINLDRVYDSYARRDGAFGQNWALSVDNSARFEVAQPPGEGWRAASRCSFFNGEVAPVPTAPHGVIVRLGGRDYRAEFRPTTGGCWFLRYPTATAHWVLLPPTYGASIQVDGEGRTLTLFDDNLLYDADGPTPGMLPYAPRFARITTADGRSYTVDRTQGLTELRDSAGASLEFTSNSVRASGASLLNITHDAAGHITAIARPDGSRRTYEYNPAGDLVASTDFGGGRYQYFYGRDHLLTRVLDPGGNVLREAEYDAAGRVVAASGSRGRGTVMRDATGRIETRTDALGAVTVVTYNDRGLVTSVTDPAGNVTRDEYDAAGHHTAHVDALGNRDVWAYDAQGRVTTITRATGRVEAATYDATTGLLAAHDDGLGHTARLTWNARGELAAYTLATGSALAFGYDTNGSLSRLTVPGRSDYVFARNAAGDLTGLTDPSGAVRAFAFTANGDLASETVTAGGVTSVTRLGYDPDGNVTTVEGPTGARAARRLDDDGRTVETTDPFGAITRVGYDSGDRVRTLALPGGRTAANTYNAVGRLSTVEAPGGRTSGFAYDRFGRVQSITQPDGRAVSLTYGPGNLVATESDGVGRVFRFTYDRFGRRTDVSLPTGGSSHVTYDTAHRVASQTGPDGVAVTFDRDAAGRPLRITRGAVSTALTYDFEGRPATVTDANGAVTRYAYDGGGRLASITDPLGAVTRYVHDPRGLVSVTDALGRVLRVTRDAAGLPTARTLPSGAVERIAADITTRTATQTAPDGRVVVRTSDAASRIVSERADDGTEARFAYTDGGELAGFSDARGTTAITRNRAGQVTGAVDPNGRVVRYTYNPAGLLTELATATATTRYEYNPAGLLTAVDDGGRRYTFTYDTAGRITARRYPNGVAEAFTYDSAGRLRSMTARSGATTHFGETYTYDAGDRVTLVEAADGGTARYTYDAAGRLLTEAVTPAGGAAETRAYTYDAVGNLLSLTDGAGERRFTYDADDRLTGDGAATYRYDAQGNLVEVAGGPRAATYRWDGLGRLVRADTTGTALGRHTVDYQYDALGLLAAKTVDGATRRYVWDLSRPVPEVLEETTPTGTVLARTVLADRALAREVGGALTQLHRDRLGSVRATSGSSGARLSALRFTAYGEPIGAAPDAAQPYGFTGELSDPTTGHYYLRARHYAPHLGRFLSRDPAVPDPRDPRALNRYAYALGAPTVYVDPTGRTALLEYAILLRTLPFNTHVMAQYSALSGYLLSLVGAALSGNAVTDFSHLPDAAMVGFSTQFQPSYLFQLSAYVGFEALGGLPVNGHPGYGAAYGYDGFAMSGTTERPITFGYYEGFVWDAPYPSNYSGAFYSFTAPAGVVMLLAGLRSGDLGVAAAGGYLSMILGGALQLTHFYSPAAGDEPRVQVMSGTLQGQVQSHGLAIGTTIGGAGETDEWRTLLSPTNFFTFAWTNYSAPVCPPGQPCN